MTPMIQVVGWSPPPMLRCKINVDRAIFKAHEAVGIGVLICDSHGQVVAALSKKINAPLGALEAKAKAFEDGLQFAKDVGIHDFIIEGDSLIVYNAFCGHSSSPSFVASIISGMIVTCGAF